jgi:hypothetical protein
MRYQLREKLFAIGDDPITVCIDQMSHNVG